MKYFIYLILIVMVMPVVLADIELEGFDSVDYNLGDRINIGGEILVNEDVYGRLNIDLICDDENIPVYFSLVDIEADMLYVFWEEVPIGEDMLGDCYFWVKLNDDKGLLLEKTSEKIYVKKELDVSVYSDSLYKYPGDVIELNGDVKKANGLKLEEGNVSIILDNRKYYSKVEDGELNYRLTTEDNIKSGKQELVIVVSDGRGNEGKENLEVVISAIPTTLEIDLKSKTFKPKDVVNLRVLIYDQGVELIKKGVSVDLLNPNNELESSVNKESERNIEFNLDEFALPGTWKLNVVSGGLIKDEEFYVERVVDKEIFLEDNVLIVRNTGNVDFDDEIEVSLESDDKTYEVVKKTSLRPNQTVFIDLTKEVPAGAYELSVIGYPAVTGNIVLEKGVSVGRDKWVGYIALVFVLCFLMFIVFNKGKNVVSKRQKARLEGRKKLKELKSLPKKKNEFVEKSPTKEDVDFLIKKVQKQEDNKDKESGLFNMFG